MRYRQIHNIWAVCVSDAPATGYCYADYNGTKHNNPNLTPFDENLLKPIDRVTAFTYGFNIDRTNITQLGVRGLIDRAIVNRPDIQVNFNYWSVGVRNESRIGLVVNYNNASGSPIFSSDQCCFNNLTGQDTDSRNVFVAVSPDNTDLNNNIKGINQDALIHPSDLFVFGFGNCYLNSYQTRAAVGQLPQTSVGYVCSNIVGYTSGSGANIPAVYSKSGNLVNGTYFTIPRVVSSTTPSVIRPKDIVLQISDINSTYSNDATWGISSSGLAIQSFDLAVNLTREDLRTVGHILPVDRRVNFPILATVNIGSIIDNNYSGNLSQILDRNKSYDITVNMYNPSCSFSGREIAVQYKLKNAKFESVSYDYGIGNNLVGNFGFSAEIDVHNPNKGLFISGLLNEQLPEYPYNYLVLGNNATGFFFLDDGNLLIVNETSIV